MRAITAYTVHVERRRHTADDRGNHAKLREPFVSSVDIRDSKGLVIGSMMVRPFERSDGETLSIANAWAAAPELLAALQEALEHIGLVRLQPGFSVEPIRERARAAIAKAEGRLT